MPTYPATRRFFRDDEFRNENAAIAGVVRALALWENYTYARDLKITPSDAKVYADGSWPWKATSFDHRPVHGFSAGSLLMGMAEIVVPDPRAPCTRVVVQLNVVETAFSPAVSGAFYITNVSTGEVVEVGIYNSFPSTGADTWYSGTIAASPGDVLRISALNGAGSFQPFVISSLCAWWDPSSIVLPGATFNSPWYAISQYLAANDAPLSTAMLRWLGRMANAFVYDRPQMIASSWFYNPAAGTNAGYSSYSTVVGRYRVLVGTGCPSLNVQLRYRASGACSVTVDAGADSTTVTIPGAGTNSASATLTLSSTGTKDLVFTVTGSPGYCDVEHVLVHENPGTATSLALPSESVPSNYDPNLDERIGSGRAIRNDDLSRLVSNMIWLWAYRRDRVLVNDCRFTYREQDDFTFTGAGGAADRAAFHEHRTSKWNFGHAFGELRVRAGYHQGASGGVKGNWDALKFQVGLATASDYPGANAIGLDVQYRGFPYSDWTQHDQHSQQHRRGVSLTSETTYLVETHLLVNANSVPKTTRPSWLTIEELPMDTPASTYP